MAIPQKTIRGVQDIRTHTRAAASAFQAHEAYMRLSCLEMEKARRGKERESAMRRVDLIDARFKEIEGEKAELLQTLGQREGLNGRRTLAPCRQVEGVKIRY
ncbi:MAG: hypothetical protein JW883_02335 [Deltaproteobacteria bacterium]|nr:hypothetical protein [Deltaproteobacteria bacterium]